MKKPVLGVVQFLHPGVEHTPETGLAWNRGPHRRKFLLSPGRFVDRDGGATQTGSITFWGEWEPESELVARLPASARGSPAYLYRPFYRTPSDHHLLQCTDPFVFGEQFLYSCCLQGRRPRLRNLGRGSVILFGSQIASQFVLDTVFVVDRRMGYRREDYTKLRERLHECPNEVVVETLFRCGRLEPDEEGADEDEEGTEAPQSCADPDAEFMLYWGATAESPRDGMFSFVPCRPDGDPRGFPRPALAAIEGVNPLVRRGAKLTEFETVAEVRSVWEAVRMAVLALGLSLGTHVAMPEHR